MSKADQGPPAKRAVRDAVRDRRRSRSAADRIEAANALTDRLVALVRDRDARSVSCFLSAPSEPDTSGFLAWAAGHRVEVLLPVAADGHRLEWVRSHGQSTARGLYGIREPVGERLPETAVGSVDLMLIPACAVDRRGVRLGWGLGYFDRCLASLSPAPPVFAVVFDDEVLDQLPADPHDRPVTGWVTPGSTATIV